LAKLSDLELKPSYHKGADNIANDFYLPCMSLASRYDRAVGFFSSTIFIIAWQSLKDFVKGGGKMRIVCSPVLSPEDQRAIDGGYQAKSPHTQGELLVDEIERLMENEYLSKPTKVLATLISMGVIDLKIAFISQNSLTRHKKIFHDKVGIFKDALGNAVVFKGSMNETWTGLSSDGNIESVDVYVSWQDDRDRIRAEDEMQYFETLWENNYPTVSVFEFPEIAKEKFNQISDLENWEQITEEILQEIEISKKLSADKKIGGKTPRHHQSQALTNWMKVNRRGILEHATGSGKTFTAICAIRDSLERGETPIVFVPSELLLKQWKSEMSSLLEDIHPQILLCGGGNTAWFSNRLLRLWSEKSLEPRIIISTIQTASRGNKFTAGLIQGDHLFIVADEVHRLGSNETRKLFRIKSGPRLGLSATPRRFGDDEGTKEIFGYFGDIVKPKFTLQDAINSKVLTSYMYYVHKIKLTENEQIQWNNLTNRIKKIYARMQSSKKAELEFENRMKMLLIKRARIIKSAENKTGMALDVIKKHYGENQRWIIYCDNQNQLFSVLTELHKSGYIANEYHSNMSGDKEETLRNFEVNGGILVSIKCLDEGVDIPNVTHALILASSKNPREFIQRRGRVLRKATNKPLAYVHDVIVIPKNNVDSDNPTNTSVLEGELSRAILFGLSAENPSSVTEIRRIALEFNINYEALVNEGYEDDEE
jgi:superfamily II DNA or RNA helicase